MVLIKKKKKRKDGDAAFGNDFGKTFGKTR